MTQDKENQDSQGDYYIITKAEQELQKFKKSKHVTNSYTELNPYKNTPTKSDGDESQRRRLTTAY